MPFYSWSEFLSPHFHCIKGIKKHHHFEISSDKLGVLKVKLYADSAVTTQKLLKNNWALSSDHLPRVIPPPGLSAERQWYLYDNIREFCTPETMDVMCPLPSVPKPTVTSQQLPSPTPSPPATPCPSPPAKRQ